MKVILHLTKNCNLRCKYCYAPAKVNEAMSIETAKKAVDLAIRLGGGAACVSFFGGEPLLEFDRIREVTRYAREAGARTGTRMHFRMSTNGTLFDEESLAFCRDNGVLFAISLDGDRRAHDVQRITAAGAGSFATLDEKLDRILAYNPYTVVTSVITPWTVDRLYPSLEYMWGRGLRFIVHQLDYTHPGWTPKGLERLERSYRRMARFYADRIREGVHFHLGLFDDKVKSHARSPIRLGELCDFGRKKLSIAADGRVFPCVQFVSDRPEAQDFCIGHVETGLTAKREALIAENRSERPQCRGCALAGRCANYCGCLNWQLTGCLTQVPGLLCAHERMLIPIADEIGNELWDERNAHFLAKHYRDFDERFAYPLD